MVNSINDGTKVLIKSTAEPYKLKSMLTHVDYFSCLSNRAKISKFIMIREE